MGDLNQNFSVGQLQKATFPPVLVSFSLSIPLPFPHALASGAHFSLGFHAEAEIKTWILADSRRDDSVNLCHAESFCLWSWRTPGHLYQLRKHT